jgi:hypothetical protein
LRTPSRASWTRSACMSSQSSVSTWYDPHRCHRCLHAKFELQRFGFQSANRNSN